MEEKPPVQRNTFVIVAAVLFNLLWIGLLFLSCQTDNQPDQTPTPDARIEDRDVLQLAAIFERESIDRNEVQTWVTVDTFSKNRLVPLGYSVPLYNPPSTCSITPVI